MWPQNELNTIEDFQTVEQQRANSIDQTSVEGALAAPQFIRRMDDNVDQRKSSDADDSPADIDVGDKGDHRDQEGIDQRGEGAARRQFALLGRRFAKGALRLDGNGDEEQ